MTNQNMNSFLFIVVPSVYRYQVWELTW